ncbi:Uma2 family endonuclease [Kribbella sp. DT2]|uniref:Uma2 family endonuclease n=1 Tax=Kribbella sp. DT2 TaxID=3393427 RepID=UPI003CEE65CE
MRNLGNPSTADGLYEVIDGHLQITAPQPPAHQAAIVALMIKLKSTCPPHLRVAVDSLGFRPTPRHTFHPDLLICPAESAGPVFTPRLSLAVEVLSPTTRVTDVVHKRALYERFGVPSYWLVDPDRQELTVLELARGHYICQAVIQYEESHRVDLPFPVDLSPAEFLG